MKVLVTGGAGKAGRYIVADLLRRVASGELSSVTVLDRVTPEAGRAAIHSVIEGSHPESPALTYIQGDLGDLNVLTGVCEGVSAIVHLAAIPRPGLVPDSVCFQTNVTNTYNIHEAAISAGVQRVVSMSSTAVLGWDWGRRERLPLYLPLDEEHPMMPEDAYGLSKQVSEQISRSFSQRTGIETVCLRPGWVVTPAELMELKQQGGRVASGIHHYSYLDTRDLATAVWQAMVVEGLRHELFFVGAEDSTLAEPLSTALAKVAPAVAEMAERIPGLSSGLCTERARHQLRFSPQFSWRTAPSAVATAGPSVSF